MRAPLFRVIVLALVATSVARVTLGDGCMLTIADVEVTTVSDSFGNVLSQSTTYWFAWYCTTAAGGYYEVPIPRGGGSDPQPPSPQPPPTGGCTVTMCNELCDVEYAAAIAGEFVETPEGGSTTYKCGPLCVDLATSNRNACYAECIEDCN